MDHSFAVNPYGQRREILIGISVPALKVAALLRFPITTSVLSANGALKRQPSAMQTTGKRNDPPSVDSEGGRYVLLANLFFTCSANRRHAIGLNLSVGP